MTKISTYFIAFSMMTSLVAFSATTVSAQEATAIAVTSSETKPAYDYSFDKLHTQIHFAVNHLGFSNSHGRFLDFDGGFNFDEADPAKSNVDVTIQTASIDMADKAWDDHMKNADFFNVEKYPTMTFKSTKVTLTGDNAADVHGDLTILDVTKPVVLKTVFNKVGEHPYSKKHVAGFSGTAKIKRSDFGMTYGLPAVGDDVSITIEVEGVKNDVAGQ